VNIRYFTSDFLGLHVINCSLLARHFVDTIMRNKNTRN